MITPAEPIACIVSNINFVHSVFIESFETIDEESLIVLDIDSLVANEIEEDSFDNHNRMDVDIQEDIGELAEEQTFTDENETEIPEADSLTIEEFLMKYENSESPLRYAIEAYTSREKLNVKESQVLNDHYSYKINYDLDGLFGFLEFEQFGEAIKCPVLFSVFPSAVDQRTSKNIGKMLKIPSGTHLSSYLFGRIDSSIGHLDLIVVVNSSRQIDPSILSEIMKQCSVNARKLECIFDQQHNCPSSTIRDGHQSTMRASTSSHQRNEFECYNEVVAVCYCYHFKKVLDRELYGRNIRGTAKIFFKSVATKSATRSDKLSSIIKSVNLFTEAFKLDSFSNDSVFVDFCLSATATSNADIGKVSII